MITAQDLARHPDLPGLMPNLNTLWEEEQQRRHKFWEDVDPRARAEFIEGIPVCQDCQCGMGTAIADQEFWLRCCSTYK